MVGTADIVAKGGVGLVVRKRQEGWSVELTRFHGPNMVSCELFSGTQQTPIVGSYLPRPLFITFCILRRHSTASWGGTLVMEDPNADIGRLQKPWNSMLKVLEGFHHRFDWWISGITAQKVR